MSLPEKDEIIQKQIERAMINNRGTLLWLF
jgi:hypothetical protein